MFLWMLLISACMRGLPAAWGLEYCKGLPHAHEAASSASRVQPRRRMRAHTDAKAGPGRIRVFVFKRTC
jgi:hypothetical protein